MISSIPPDRNLSPDATQWAKWVEKSIKDLSANAEIMDGRATVSEAGLRSALDTTVSRYDQIDLDMSILMNENEVFRENMNEALQDAAQPLAPTITNVTTVGYWEHSDPKSEATVTAIGVIEDENGGIFFLNDIEYEVEINDGTRLIGKGLDVDVEGEEYAPPTVVVSAPDLTPGTNLTARMRAVSISGGVSEWSNEFPFTTNIPELTLKKPSAPILTTSLGMVQVDWDGKLEGDSEPPPSFKHNLVEWRLDSESEWEKSPVGTGWLREGLTKGDKWHVRLIAVDTLDRETDPGPSSSIVVEDEVADAIDHANDIAEELREAKEDLITTHNLAMGANTAAQSAVTAAGNAVGIAEGKANVLIQSATPAVDMRKDTTLWIDTTDGNNTPKRWSGSAWVAVTDKVAVDAAAAAVQADINAAQALTSANGKSTVYYQTATPSDPKTGDRWYNITTGVAQIYSGTSWVDTTPGEGFVPQLDIGRGTAGEMEIGRLKVGDVGFSTAVGEAMAANQGFFQDLMANRLLIGSSNMVTGAPQLGTEPHTPWSSVFFDTTNNDTLGPVWEVKGGSGTDGSMGAVILVGSGYVASNGMINHFDCVPGTTYRFRALFASGGYFPPGLTKTVRFGVFWRGVNNVAISSQPVAITNNPAYHHSGGTLAEGVATAPEGAVSFYVFIQKNFWSDGTLFIKDINILPQVNSVLIENGAITSEKITVDALVGKTITGATITGTNISGTTITGGSISGTTITGGKITQTNTSVSAPLVMENGKFSCVRNVTSPNVGPSGYAGFTMPGRLTSAGGFEGFLKVFDGGTSTSSNVPTKVGTNERLAVVFPGSFQAQNASGQVNLSPTYAAYVQGSNFGDATWKEIVDVAKKKIYSGSRVVSGSIGGGVAFDTFFTAPGNLSGYIVVLTPQGAKGAVDRLGCSVTSISGSRVNITVKNHTSGATSGSIRINWIAIPQG